MLNTNFDSKNGMFSISSYNGYFDREKFIYLDKLVKKDTPENYRWDFFRENSNNSYIQNGDISYHGDCNNNLIISSNLKNDLTNIKNAFVFVGDSFVEVSPIFNILNVIEKGKKSLLNQKIHYNIPQAVFKRENLLEKDLENLKKEIKLKYGIKPEEISLINSKRTKNGIYYFKEKDGKEYMLKFRGESKEKAELLSQIAENNPNYFPLNFRRKDGLNFTFEIGGELYGLEEFIRGSNQKPRDLEYFSLLGNYIGLLHNNFSSFFKNNRWVKEVSFPFESNINEGSMVAFYLDLINSNKSDRILVSKLEGIIEKKLSNRMKNFPINLIHGDLNYSNLIWKKRNPKIIDSETMKISKRLNEFESPLLFGGNMEKPKYIPNSLEKITSAYNQSSNLSLSKEEKKILPSLLSYSLLKNFVVRNIRRGLKDEKYLNEIKRNLELIEEDSK